MKILVDKKMSAKVKASLSRYGEVIALPEWKNLPDPISSHPDILFHPLPSGEVLVGYDYYQANREFFDGIACSFILGKKTPCGSYPNDIIYDCLGVNDVLYGKEGSIAEELLFHYSRFVPVKQGYARCSVALLGKGCAVTADMGLSLAMKKNGIDVLDIRSGCISLSGYDSGFIGGSGAALGDGIYGFFGDIYSHPDGEKIVEFAFDHKIKAVSLSDEPLSDNGGLLII